jgi:phosphate-selective porin
MSKSITQSLLALAVSSSLLIAQDAKAPGGWKASPGSGLSFDGGDAFGLKWVNRLQIHWTNTNNDGDNPNTTIDTSSFNIRRARTHLSGHVFSKNILYALYLDGVDSGPAGDGNIKQAWAQWNFSKSDDGAIGMRVGQAKTMFGLEATMSSSGLWFVERSSASRAFADSYSRGAWLVGHMMKERPLRFALGAMNTDVAAGLSTAYVDRGEETANSDNELSYVLSANFDPLGDFHGGKQTTESNQQGDFRTEKKDFRGTIGVGVALGNGKDSTVPAGDVDGQDIESTSINLNTAWAVAGFHVLGEYFMRTDDVQGPAQDEEEPSGYAVSLGYLLDKSADSAIQWGFGLRYSFIETDEGAATSGVRYLTGGQGIGSTLGEVAEISAVINAFYHSHACKTQIDYTIQDIEPDSGSGWTNNLLRIGFQIQF